jgi:hypothetical protein
MRIPPFYLCVRYATSPYIFVNGSSNITWWLSTTAAKGDADNK